MEQCLVQQITAFQTNFILNIVLGHPGSIPVIMTSHSMLYVSPFHLFVTVGDVTNNRYWTATVLCWAMFPYARISNKACAHQEVFAKHWLAGCWIVIWRHIRHDRYLCWMPFASWHWYPPTRLWQFLCLVMVCEIVRNFQRGRTHPA